ncbi:hypothetical protein VIGAN_10046800 [Vigna angularis var. angularis]|uniref:Uncharacterized protein n=1 Tax=Vigna angularis var. angularis TaxID=157739 RepID=A0A0S3T1K4_PHAAN|nr:hypothetical protein VIGAN_10046800 [Vigna angularis var. angularis]
MLERVLNPLALKSSVLVLRCVNNFLGGMSFVELARLTRPQNHQKMAEARWKKMDGLDGEKWCSCALEPSKLELGEACSVPTLQNCPSLPGFASFKEMSLK